MSYKILCYPQNPNVQKSIIAGKYNGIEIDYPAFQFGVDNKTPEFLALNPNGKVPVLVGPEGALFESNAILRYVSRLGKAAVYGKNAYEAAQIDQWIDWAAFEIAQPMYAVIGPILGYFPYNKKNEQEALVKIQKALTILDDVLKTRTFLVGDRISAADLSVSSALHYLFSLYFDAKLRAPYQNVLRWFTTIVNQPTVKSVIGDFKLCEVQQKPQLPKKEEKKAAPKPEASKPKPKVEEEPEEEAPVVQSGFSLDDFKRVYSNSDVAESIPYFFEKFDANTHSVYFCKYKYNEDNKVTFMTRNLIGGFFQRLDLLRKIGFGSMVISGEETEHVISGVWIFKGQDIPEAMQNCDDSLCYDFRKADVTNAEDKKLIEDYLHWDRPIEGKAFIDGKIFK